jgi:predicted P-loop ATPase
MSYTRPSICGRTLSFHPARDYQDALVWDGEARLDGWLSIYLGAAKSEYHRIIGPKFLIMSKRSGRPTGVSY